MEWLSIAGCFSERGRVAFGGRLESHTVGLRQAIEICVHQRGAFGLIQLLDDHLDLLFQTTDVTHGRGSPISSPLAMVQVVPALASNHREKVPEEFINAENVLNPISVHVAVGLRESRVDSSPPPLDAIQPGHHLPELSASEMLGHDAAVDPAGTAVVATIFDVHPRHRDFSALDDRRCGCPTLPNNLAAFSGQLSKWRIRNQSE